MGLRIDLYGPDALLVRFALKGDGAAFGQSQALLDYLSQHPLPGLVEATPGFTTLLLEFEPGRRPDSADLAVVFQGVARSARRNVPHARLIEVPVVYDGPDLAEVAARARITVTRLIELHSAPVYQVRLMGFSPGFPYLTGLDSRLHTPRRSTPRPSVPAGAVAIGGEYTGIYPVATAGGWNLIGRTSLPMLSAEGAAQGDPQAFRFQVTDAVRFVPMDASPPA